MDDTLQTDYLSRVRQFYQHCARNDLAVAVAQTDVKGDRSLGPSQQTHPDYYVHIVDERPDGIVVRGAKIHTSVLTNANEVIVLPTRNMSEADRDYAVAFAIPVNTPGLKMICSPYGAPRPGHHDHPITSQHKMTETLTVFDDVFVPRERVFLQKEWQFAGDLAKTFVEAPMSKSATMPVSARRSSLPTTTASRVPVISVKRSPDSLLTPRPCGL